MVYGLDRIPFEFSRFFNGVAENVCLLDRQETETKIICFILSFLVDIPKNVARDGESLVEDW